MPTTGTFTQEPRAYGGDDPVLCSFMRSDRVKLHLVEWTPPSSYQAGGDPWVFRLCPTPIAVFFSPDIPGDLYYQYDYTNKKIKAFVASTGVEVAGAVDLSGKKVKILVLGPPQ